LLNNNINKANRSLLKIKVLALYCEIKLISRLKRELYCFNNILFLNTQI